MAVRPLGPFVAFCKMTGRVPWRLCVLVVSFSCRSQPRKRRNQSGLGSVASVSFCEMPGANLPLLPLRPPVKLRETTFHHGSHGSALIFFTGGRREREVGGDQKSEVSGRRNPPAVIQFVCFLCLLWPKYLRCLGELRWNLVGPALACPP